MTELNKIHISEIATLYAVQDKPDAYYYEAKEADKKILELELALWFCRIRFSQEQIRHWIDDKFDNADKKMSVTHDVRISDDELNGRVMVPQDWIDFWFEILHKCRKKANEIKKKLEEM